MASEALLEVNVPVMITLPLTLRVQLLRVRVAPESMFRVPMTVTVQALLRVRVAELVTDRLARVTLVPIV